MRWRDREESENVEDRRDEPSGRGFPFRFPRGGGTATMRAKAAEGFRAAFLFRAEGAAWASWACWCFW